MTTADKAIFFDMDGTIVDLYNVKEWLKHLTNNSAKPYETAEPLLNMQELQHLLKQLQERGYYIGIISWGSKNSTNDFLKATERAKKRWLKKHLSDFRFNSVTVTNYGTSKSETAQQYSSGVLFDDNETVRNDWTNKGGKAYSETNILAVLKELLKNDK